MKRSIDFLALADDNRFEGHYFEMWVDSESSDPFETIRSCGDYPLSTQVASITVELCYLVDEMLEAINSLGEEFETTRDEVENHCTWVRIDKSIVLDTDYSNVETTT